MSDNPSTLNKSSTGPIILGVGAMLLIMAAKLVYKNLVDNSVDAGPERGDIRLSSDVLPENIDDWKISNFREPDQEGGIAGIIGWTHSWNARQDKMSGLVCFDQVGFMGWHELTLCYKATGWTVTERSLKLSYSPEARGWYSVSAKLSNAQNDQALIIYSIFDGTGAPKSPPEISGYIPGSSLSQEQKRCLQCQVMVPFQGSLSAERQDQVYQLHITTRELFREEWLRQKSMSKSPGSSVSQPE